jgi:hypothetical protein
MNSSLVSELADFSNSLHAERVCLATSDEQPRRTLKHPSNQLRRLISSDALIARQAIMIQSADVDFHRDRQRRL